MWNGKDRGVRVCVCVWCRGRDSKMVEVLVYESMCEECGMWNREKEDVYRKEEVESK